MEPTPSEWKTRTLLFGGLFGALAGVLAAFIFIQSSGEGKPSVHPKAALQAGIGVMGVLKQIASLAEE